MLPEFQKGKPITAKDLNAIVSAVVRLMNITGNSGIQVTKNANGFSILVEASRHVLHGVLQFDLPYGKAGVIRVQEPDPEMSEADLEPPSADIEEAVDGPDEENTERYEWVINYCLENGKKLTTNSRVICVRRKGWWYIVAASPCPDDV